MNCLNSSSYDPVMIFMHSWIGLGDIPKNTLDMNVFALKWSTMELLARAEHILHMFVTFSP